MEKKKTNQKPALEKPPQELPFAFSKMNYILMIAGVVIITLGFTIMALEEAQHGFGFFGLTLGPIITFLGFMFEIFAILYKPKDSPTE